ncbi:MAG: methionine--tRNA ligase [Chthoniobacterales bacterium]
MKIYFITTAIDYTNAAPHIGHAYEKILADVLARYQRLRGRIVFFLTGVDQHGQKVQQAAEQAGISPQKFADDVSEKFIQLWKELSISYDDWAATTDVRHSTAVQKILTHLLENDWLYKATYQGYYSVRQEQFLTDKERGADGEFGVEWGEVVFLEEENWYFRLSRCKEWLTQFLEKTADFVTPQFRQAELKNAAAKVTGDLCISRPKSRLAWGIELPFDKDFVTYVWFDALINYISFAGYNIDGDQTAGFSRLWPCDHHVIGKDIMVPAHGVYWPCMLHAMGFSDEQMPQLLVHGFWSLRGEKVSKSTGNVVDPFALVETYGASALRYYLMRDAVMGKDADFHEDRLLSRYHTELGNGLGNLVNRTLSMTHRYRAGSPNRVDLPEDCRAHLAADVASIKKYSEQMDASQIHAGLETMINLVYRANALVDSSAPWNLAKDSASADRLDAILSTLLQSARIAATLLMPVVPAAATEILKQLALKPVSLIGEIIIPEFPEKYIAGHPSPVFPRIE